MTYKNCVKCGEKKEEGETECQHCGVIYAKAERVINKQNEIEQEKVEVERETTPSRVSFEYIDADGNRTARTISSAHRFNYNGRMYLAGHCELRNEQRTFRSDRISGDLVNAKTGEIIGFAHIIKVDPPGDWSEAQETKKTAPKNLHECSACGKYVSKNAESCPGCGEPFTKTTAYLPKQRNASANGIGCGTIILIILGISYCNSIFKSSPPPKQEQPSQIPVGQQQRNAVESIAQAITRNSLKSPSKADFVYSSTKTFNIGPGRYEVGGQVDAQNSFGATIRNIWMVQLAAVNPCDDYHSTGCWTVTAGPFFTEK